MGSKRDKRRRKQRRTIAHKENSVSGLSRDPSVTSVSTDSTVELFNQAADEGVLKAILNRAKEIDPHIGRTSISDASRIIQSKDYRQPKHAAIKKALEEHYRAASKKPPVIIRETPVYVDHADLPKALLEAFGRRDISLTKIERITKWDKQQLLDVAHGRTPIDDELAKRLQSALWKAGYRVQDQETESQITTAGFIQAETTTTTTTTANTPAPALVGA